LFYRFAILLATKPDIPSKLKNIPVPMRNFAKIVSEKICDSMNFLVASRPPANTPTASTRLVCPVSASNLTTPKTDRVVPYRAT